MDDIIDSPARVRCITRIVLTGGAVGVCILVVLLSRPVYWKLYATYVNPFEDPNGATGPLITPGDQPVVLGTNPKISPGATLVEPLPSSPDPVATTPTSEPLPSPKHEPKPVTAEPTISSPETKPPDKAPETTSEPAPVVKKTEINFDDVKYQLTRERAAELAQDGHLMVTWANNHYTDFALSWVHNVRKAGITGYLVGAMDDQILKVLAEKDINTWRMNSGLSKSDFGWGSPEFRKMGRSKIRLILDTLMTGQSIIISDIDTAWLRNPIPFFQKYPDADCLTSSDLLHYSVKGEELEKWPDGVGPSANIGIMLFRNKSMPLVEAWVKRVESEDVWDQSAFNELYHMGMSGDVKDPSHLFMAYEGKVRMGILQVSQFASGHTFFVQKMYETLNLQPFVGHATFQYSGTPGKRHRFREFLLWDDPPEYFDHPNGFISFNMDIPKDLLEKSAVPPGRMLDENCILGHLALMNHQMLRLRNAFALATITGRAIILPELFCGSDKYWAPLESGRIPGTHFKLPFLCPADHVLNLEGGMTQNWPVHQFGPHIDYKEYSFLKNERLTPAVRDSKVTIEVCDAPGAAGCADGTAPGVLQDAKLKLAPGLKSREILAALKSAESFKIWNFTSMEKAFGNFSNTADWTKFVKRLGFYPSTFCCLEKSTPGWMWYDLFWDIPHHDRFNRWFDSWKIYWGDN